VRQLMAHESTPSASLAAEVVVLGAIREIDQK
jgi:hypothetical protein